MNEEETKQENEVGTAPTGTEATEKTEENAKAESQTTAEKTLTESQVNDIIVKRLAKQTESFYKKYGVADEKGLEDLIAKAKGYDELNEKYTALSGKNSELNEKVLFGTNSIKQDREDDVRTYFKGKSLEMTDEALKEALKTHSEWVEAKPTAPMPMGNTGTPKQEDDELELASKLFGMKLR